MADTKIDWADIPGFPGYMVSGHGDILSKKYKREHVLKPMRSDDGHLYVYLYIDGKQHKMWVHQAVLRSFDRAPMDGEECRHLDGIPDNNNRSNLAWGTRLENMQDKKRHGTQPMGERSGTAKLTAAQVLEIRERISTSTLRQLASEYGVSHTAIRRAALGIKWGCLNG